MNFPPNIKKMSFSSSYNCQLDSLPENLEILYCEKINMQLLNLPVNLKQIIIKDYSVKGPYYSCNKILKNMIKLPLNCQIMGATNNPLDIENTFV